MINKKTLPLKLIEDVKVFYEKVRLYSNSKNELISIKEDKDLKILLEDIDPLSDFYFSISNPSFSREKSFFHIDYKPVSAISLEPYKGAVSADGAFSNLQNWYGLVEKYYNIALTPNEALINQYEDEFFSGFEIIDDDAEFNSFDFPRQLLIQNFLVRTVEILNDEPSDNSEIIEEVNKLKDNIQNLTKKVIVRKLSRIFAVTRKKGLELCKKILIEAGKELFKKAISTGAESVYGMIIQ